MTTIVWLYCVQNSTFYNWLKTKKCTFYQIHRLSNTIKFFSNSMFGTFKLCILVNWLPHPKYNSGCVPGLTWNVKLPSIKNVLTVTQFVKCSGSLHNLVNKCLWKMFIWCMRKYLRIYKPILKVKRFTHLDVQG